MILNLSSLGAADGFQNDDEHNDNDSSTSQFSSLMSTSSPNLYSSHSESMDGLGEFELAALSKEAIKAHLINEREIAYEVGEVSLVLQLDELLDSYDRLTPEQLISELQNLKILNGQSLDGLDGDLGNIFKKIGGAVKKATSKVGSFVRKTSDKVGDSLRSGALQKVVSTVAPIVGSFVPAGSLVSRLVTSPTASLISKIPSSQAKQVVASMTPQQATVLANRIQTSPPSVRQSPLGKEVGMIKAVTAVAPAQARSYVQSLSPSQLQLAAENLNNNAQSSMLRNTPVGQEIMARVESPIVKAPDDNNTLKYVAIGGGIIAAIGIGYMVTQRNQARELGTTDTLMEETEPVIENV